MIAPAFQIATEEEYIELFGIGNDDEIFYGEWSEIGLESEEETPETQSGGEDNIEAERPEVIRVGEGSVADQKG